MAGRLRLPRLRRLIVKAHQAKPAKSNNVAFPDAWPPLLGTGTPSACLTFLLIGRGRLFLAQRFQRSQAARPTFLNDLAGARQRPRLGPAVGGAPPAPPPT